MLTILFTILHVVVSLFLILVVLAQQGKGQDLASAFGGGGSQTAFGARGTATLLSKITAGAAVTFMVTSLTLSYLRPTVAGGRTVIPATAPAAAPSAEPPAETPPPSEGEEEAGPEGAMEGQDPPAEGEGEGEAQATEPPAAQEEPTTTAPPQ